VFLLGSSLLVPGVCVSQTGQPRDGFVVSCVDGVATITPRDTEPNGLASVSLASNRVLWKAMADRTAYVGPVVARGAVAVITNNRDTVEAFSKKTGKRLWARETWSNNLGSDGAYFYILRTAFWDLQTFDPDTGKVLWSLKLPGRWLGHYPALLGITQGLLFTEQSVVDLASRRVVHTWPREPTVISAWATKNGEIVLGDSEGGITIYDIAFKRLRKVHLEGGGWVKEAVAIDGRHFSRSLSGFCCRCPGRAELFDPARKTNLAALMA
jgi:outer membrane protein assembly factor BamB